MSTFFKLRATAKEFIPGNIRHVLKKRVHWNPKGISKFKIFNIYEDNVGKYHALPKRELLGPPLSPIKESNPKKAAPFRLPLKRKSPEPSENNVSRYDYCDN